MQNVFVGGFHILLGHCTILLMVSSRILQIWSAPAGYGELSAEKKLIRNGEMNNNNHCLPSPVLIGQCSGLLRHDYRIKYAYFVKCCLAGLLPSVILKSELQMWLNEKKKT